MTNVANRPARAAAVREQETAIAANVQKIEQTRRPTALGLMASRLNISEGMLANTLKKTVFKDCRNDEEFAALVVVANEYGLNPLTKEIYAFPAKGGGVVPMVSIDGWVKIANQHPAFDGVEFNDLPDANGKLYAIEAVVYRNDRSRPIRITEYLEECKRNTDPWNKSPARMLRHRAYMQGARYAFGFSGIYSEDDADTIGEIQLVGEPVPARNVTPKREQIAHDPETGEIHQDVQAEADRAAYRQIDGRTDDQHDDSPAPSQSTAGTSGQQTATDGVAATEDELSGSEIKAREYIGGLNAADATRITAVEKEFLNNRPAFDDEQAGRIEAAIQAARKAVAA